MKKLFTFILCSIIALPLFFTSCQKEQEGVYNPKKKIERIYHERYLSYTYGYNETYEYVDPKHLSEVWNWDGNVLNSIDYFDEEGYSAERATFIYDGKRLSEIRISYDGEESYRYIYNYQDNLLSSISGYYADEQTPISTFQFTHSGKKITRIEHYEEDYSKRANSSFSPLHFTLPFMDANIIDQVEKKGVKNRRIYAQWELEWNNDNINSVKITHYHNYLCVLIEFTYDTKINPLYNMLTGDFGTGYADDVDRFSIGGTYNPVVTSKNNAVTIRENYISEEGAVDYVLNYSYDGDFPVVQECNLTYGYGDVVVQNPRDRSVVYYEYK